jgi:hypothetical protein
MKKTYIVITGILKDGKYKETKTKFDDLKKATLAYQKIKKEKSRMTILSEVKGRTITDLKVK